MNESVRALAQLAEDLGLPPEVGDYLADMAQCGCEDLCSVCCNDLAMLDRVITHARTQIREVRPDVMDLILKDVKVPPGFVPLSGSPWACHVIDKGAPPPLLERMLKPPCHHGSGFHQQCRPGTDAGLTARASLSVIRNSKLF